MQWFKHTELTKQLGLDGRFESYTHDLNSAYCNTIVLLINEYRLMLWLADQYLFVSFEIGGMSLLFNVHFSC